MPQVVAAATAAYTTAVNFIAGIPGLATIAGEGGAVLIAQGTVNFAINAAVAFGINAIARSGMPDAEFAASNRKQAIPDRMSGYGRARLGGAYMLWESQDSYAYNVLALHDGQVDGFEQFYLNDDKVTLITDGFVQTGTDGRYGRRSDLVQIDTRVGLPIETRYSQITDTSIWPADARGDGIASLMMIAKSSSQEFYLRDFPNGLPLPSVVTRMQICYDARLGERDDPLAWVWTQNPVWQLLDYMTNVQTGMRLDYAQYFEPNIDQWIAAADVCDEPVPLAAGGTIPRYTGDGTYLHSSPPADVMATILACMDGWMAQDTGGVFVIQAGEYAAPSITITDAHIVSMDRQFYLEDERAVNELVISYTSAAYDYTEVEALPWRDETDIAERNGSVRSQRMSLPWVSSNSQARRLAKIAMARATAQIRGTITTDLYGLKAMGQRRIRIQAPADSQVMANIVVDVVNVTLNSDFTVTIPFVASSEASYEWDAATEEDSQPVIPRPEPSDIPVPVLLAAVYDPATSRIEVTVQGPVDESLSYQLSWNAQDGDPPQQIEFPVGVESGANWIVYTTPTIPTTELIDVAVAFITSSGAVGEYSNVLTASSFSNNGAANITEASDTVTSAAQFGPNITGTATITEMSDTVTGVSAVGITGAATITEAGDTLTGSGDVGLRADILLDFVNGVYRVDGVTYASATDAGFTGSGTFDASGYTATGTQRLTGTVALPGDYIVFSEYDFPSPGVTRILWAHLGSGAPQVSYTDPTISADGFGNTTASATRVAAGRSGGVQKSSFGNASVVTGSSSSAPGTNSFYVGNYASNAWGVPIKSIAIYKQTLTDAQIQTLTAA